MTTRTTDHRVTVVYPFALPGWEGAWPAGEYTVTTNEELLDTSFPAYHRVSTTIALRKGAETRHVEIVPLQLAAALDRDRRVRPGDKKWDARLLLDAQNTLQLLDGGHRFTLKDGRDITEDVRRRALATIERLERSPTVA